MTVLFFAASVVAIAGALGVVVASTPVHGVLAMLVNFAGLSALFLSLNAEFLAVAQIIIYAGAVMVLFLFVISLLSARNRPAEGPDDRLRLQIPLGMATVAALVAGIVMGLLGPSATVGPAVQGWQPAPEGFGSVEAFGQVLLGAFPFELEVAGLVLLVALVGVMVVVGRRAEVAEPARPPGVAAARVEDDRRAEAADGAGSERAVPVGVASGENRG